ncbi:FKBP-type peptidyl-prolyl cis-trans isomerase [Brevundimonas sp.]|uniref:FKBP-type peptidyl-prolyl cis-trans isomerase n=1 Tax=Brevundimonas sp. TaxID=1871086 RepID=UPI003BAA98CC
MRFGWVSVLSVGVLALAGCGRSAVSSADLEQNARAAAFFMEANAKEEGVQTLASGLQYKVVQSGPSGAASPDSNDLVRVDYEGALTDGTVFDSSFAKGQPFVTSPEQVVPGWTEALQRMKAGDEWLLYVPPALGYGERGGGTKIPGNAVLVFRIKLLDVAPVPGGNRGVGVAMG